MFSLSVLNSTEDAFNLLNVQCVKPWFISNIRVAVEKTHKQPVIEESKS